MISLHHILREGNFYANIFEKLSSNFTEPLVQVCEPPPELSSALLADALGVSFIMEMFFLFFLFPSFSHVINTNLK